METPGSMAAIVRASAKLWPARIIAALEAAGFEAVRRHTELGIFSEYRAVKPDSSAAPR